MVRLAKNVFLLLIILKYNWLFWHIDWQIYHNKNRAIPLHTNRRSNNFRKITQSRNCLPFVSIWVHLWPFGGVHVAHIFSCYVSLRPWIPCCDVRYDFRMNTMFGSCLPPVVYMKTRVLFPLFVFVYALWCPTYIVLFIALFFFVFCARFSGLCIFDCSFGIL
jgi:hypothetical protein